MTEQELEEGIRLKTYLTNRIQGFKELEDLKADIVKNRLGILHALDGYLAAQL